MNTITRTNTNQKNTYQRFAHSHATKSTSNISSPTFAVGLDSLTSQHHSASVKPPLTCYNGYNPNYTCHSGSW